MSNTSLWIVLGLFALLLALLTVNRIYQAQKNKNSIRQIELIRLSLKNLKAKKARAAVTIGGMALGIGTIVFLVSLAYGIQNIIISRVAGLGELTQANILPQQGSKIKLTDSSLNAFSTIKNVQNVLPLISVVSKVSYQNSVIDMAAYGVTNEYLSYSSIQPRVGKFFTSNEVTLNQDGIIPSAGVLISSGSVGMKLQDIQFTINSNAWIPVYRNPSETAEIIGYTKYLSGSQTGTEALGDKYETTETNPAVFYYDFTNQKELNKWVLAPLYLWQKPVCETGLSNCGSQTYTEISESNGTQKQAQGYIAETQVQKTNDSTAVTADQATDSTISSAWITLNDLGKTVTQSEKTIVTLSPIAKKEAVVNESFLKVLGLDESEAVGKQFGVTFRIPGELLSDSSRLVESSPDSYTIVGVIAGGDVPYFYAPFIDFRSMGIDNYSQVKINSDREEYISQIRQQIEVMGYTTTSVSDTVSQIDNYFSIGRILLIAVGMLALAVAILGMFNTLTVSLLERTREVGFMKAIGMRSDEVQDVFLSESLIISISGGILGIIVGFVGGKVVSLILSIYAITKGGSAFDVSYVPFSFMVIIFLLSIGVGIITGYFPAKRATKISALDALRYE